MFGTGAKLTLASLAVGLASAASAYAQAPVGPYDGSIPFNCELQQAGLSDLGPNPEADPYCVEFDKTEQNLTDSGFVEFLALEPTRVGAAGPKCFYFQRDHWTGSVVQGQPPELYHWDGNYFFDKAKGIGGVHVTNFRVAGQAQDPGPFAPPAYAPYFDVGGGGVMVTQVSEVDPACVALAEENDVYANDPKYRDCIPPGGELQGKRVGRVKLGTAPKRVRGKLGKPRSRKRGVDRWCVIGGASLRVAYRRGSPKGVALIRTSSKGHSEGGVRPGDKRRRANRKLGLKTEFTLGGTDVAEAPRHARRQLFVGMRGRRVRWLAMVDPDRLRSDSAVRRALRRTR